MKTRATHFEHGQFDPALGRLAPALAWLRDRGVDVRRLAIAFRTNPTHVRVLAHRGRLGAAPPVGKDGGLTLALPMERDNNKPTTSFEYSDDSVLPNRMRLAELERIEEHIDARWQVAERAWRLLDTARELRRLGTRFGRPRSIRLLRLRGKLRHHLSWCLVHTGLAHSAAVAALRAIQDARLAYAETLDPFDLRFISQTALVASHSHLLRRQPARAEAFLRLARESAEGARISTPADYFRQSAVAAFQRGDDDAARVLFARAGQTLVEQEPGRGSLDVRFTSSRHTDAMHPADWDRASELLADVREGFGANSLQASMMTHWSVAAGFSTDSPSIVQHSRLLLDRIAATASRFGHQTTIHRLLFVTPDLHLPSPERREWIRWLMYANAYGRR